MSRALHPQRPGARPACGRGHGHERHPQHLRCNSTSLRPRHNRAASPTVWPLASRAVAEPLTDAEPDLLVHFTFPEAHRGQLRSTKPLERLNKEIKRRTAVVGVFPSRPGLVRLVGIVLFEQDDEWKDGRRCISPESMTQIDAIVDRHEVDAAPLIPS
jgi:hypothetical protein